ncbi:MAG: GAF domain-containing protein [Chloroflexi bacterium]|nr:GAF domain-containing protein [Chloroflexota bacterium]
MERLIPCEWLSIVLYNRELTEERAIAWQQASELQIHVGDSQPVVPNDVLERLKAGLSVVTPDLATQHGPKAQLAEDLETQHMHSAMANPMLVQGRLIGVLALASTKVNFFTLEHQQIAEEIADQIAIALHQAELYDQIARHNFELEQRVRDRTAELEHVNRELEMFSYSVSHDLRAPLRAVQGFAEIIARRHRSSLNEEGQRYFDYIVDAGGQMNQLITDLLDYSRLGRQHVRFGTIPLRKLLLEVIEMLQPQITKYGAQIDLAEALPDVRGDKTLLMQIFANLLENGMIYQRPGVSPVVRVDCTIEPEAVVVRVADNGLGIDQEFHEKIFNVFQRLHSAEHYPGTGIGLAIVRRSVELLNGSIWLESTVGVGSQFYVRLPRPTGL